MDISPGFAEVNGTRLYYEVAGSGHPLVLVHGLTLDQRMWDDQFEPFAQHYRVVRYDARGYGRSAQLTGEPFDRANDLKGLLDYLGIPRAYVLGLSMGGSIAIEFARAFPQMTAAVIPVDTGLASYPFRTGWAAEFDAIFATGKATGAEAAKQQWLNSSLFAPACEQPTVAARLEQMVSEYSGWIFVNSSPPGLSKPSTPEQLADIQAPTLIILGERDLPEFHNIAAVVQRLIPRARTVVMPGVGHMSNMENPALFNQIVLQFLSTLSEAKR